MRLLRAPGLIVLGALVSGCGDETPPPQAVITNVAPSEICPYRGMDPTYVTITGEHLDQPLTVLWVSATGAGFADQAVYDDAGAELVVAFHRGEGGPAALEPPIVYTLRLEDEHGRVTERADALTHYSTLSVATVDPADGAGTVSITLDGAGFHGDLAVTLDATPPIAATAVTVVSSSRVTAELDLADTAAGTYAVTVTNPGGCSAAIAAAFTVP
jgi:hypothetical protein